MLTFTFTFASMARAPIFVDLPSDTTAPFAGMLERRLTEADEAPPERGMLKRAAALESLPNRLRLSGQEGPTPRCPSQPTCGRRGGGGRGIAGRISHSGASLEERLARHEGRGKGRGRISRASRGTRYVQKRFHALAQPRGFSRATGRVEPMEGDPPPSPKDIGCTEQTRGLRLPWASTGGLPALPIAWNDTSKPLPSYQRTRPKQCAVLVDRHVHKNGGSTIRDLLLEQERLGFALYQGYTQLYWRQIFAKLQRLFQQATETGQPPRLLMLIEAHFGWVELNGPVLKDLHTLKALQPDCPVVTMTRVREPLDFYLSFFQWGVAFRQKEPGNSFGKSFEEWARLVPNLQSTMMLKSMAASDAEYHPRSYMRSYNRRGGAEQLASQVKEFLGKMDIVATMARFDESVLMAADLTGLPQLLYKRNMPNKKGGFRKTKPDICPDWQKCVDLIKEVAPVDHAVYAEFQPAFEKRVAGLGADFAARVADYKAQLKGAQAVWNSALRKQFLCRYHPEENTKVWKLRRDNVRCPVEGKGAVQLCQAAYAYRTFECPWQYQPNTSVSDSMGCWRPSTGFK